jgi:hypothetical protein
MTDELPVVTWDKVRFIADEAFCIWVGQPELRWAEQAWLHLTKLGLTLDGTALVRLTVYVRFLVLASVYRDWCAIVWDEVHDDSPELWISESDVDRLHIGQLLGPDVELDEFHEGIADALLTLMDREREAVVTALLAGFGSTEDLFIALWRSNKDPDDEQSVEDDDDRLPPETDADILNETTRPHRRRWRAMSGSPRAANRSVPLDVERKWTIE